jgi:hypothetical protein
MMTIQWTWSSEDLPAPLAPASWCGLLWTDDDDPVDVAVVVAEEGGRGGAGYAIDVEVPTCR